MPRNDVVGLEGTGDPHFVAVDDLSPSTTRVVHHIDGAPVLERPVQPCCERPRRGVSCAAGVCRVDAEGGVRGLQELQASEADRREGRPHPMIWHRAATQRERERRGLRLNGEDAAPVIAKVEGSSSAGLFTGRVVAGPW